MKLFAHYAKMILPEIFLALICLSAESFAELIQPTLLSNIVDIGVANGDFTYILRTAALMLAIVILSAFAAIGRNNFASIGAQKFGKKMRSDMFSKIYGFTPDELDRFGMGTLMTRLTNDVTQLQGMMQGLMRVFIKAPILCVGGVIMALRLNFSLGIIPLICVPVIFVLIILNMRVGFPMFGRVQESLDRVNSVMREYLSGVRVVKAFNRFDYEVLRFDKPNSDLMHTSVNASRVMAIFNPAVTLVIYAGIVAILWFGGVKVDAGTMRTGQIIAFVSYMTQILHALNIMSNIFQRIVRSGASLKRVKEVMDSGNDEKLPKNSIKCNLSRGISFDRVTFSYKNSTARPALSDITFSCDIGESVGVIGSTGSGKTTLVSLIMQFYAPNKGKVQVFGTSIDDTNPTLIRENISVVQQNVRVFTGTIRENILWGAPNATEDEMYEAAKSACAHEFIMSFTDGYDTLIGHNGANVSGGQRQRIAIARALIRKPRLLILDDCLSAVDALTEAAIRASLKKYAKESACVIVSQKISSIIDCDRIIVLEDGCAAGVGTHRELLEGSAVYRDIYLSQYGQEALING